MALTAVHADLLSTRCKTQVPELTRKGLFRTVTKTSSPICCFTSVLAHTVRAYFHNQAT